MTTMDAKMPMTMATAVSKRAKTYDSEHLQQTATNQAVPWIPPSKRRPMPTMAKTMTMTMENAGSKNDQDVNIVNVPTTANDQDGTQPTATHAIENVANMTTMTTMAPRPKQLIAFNAKFPAFDPEELDKQIIFDASLYTCSNQPATPCLRKLKEPNDIKNQDPPIAFNAKFPTVEPSIDFFFDASYSTCSTKSVSSGSFMVAFNDHFPVCDFFEFQDRIMFQAPSSPPILERNNNYSKMNSTERTSYNKPVVCSIYLNSSVTPNPFIASADCSMKAGPEMCSVILVNSINFKHHPPDLSILAQNQHSAPVSVINSLVDCCLIPHMSVSTICFKYKPPDLRILAHYSLRSDYFTMLISLKFNPPDSEENCRNMVLHPDSILTNQSFKHEPPAHYETLITSKYNPVTMNQQKQQQQRKQ